MRQPHSLPLIKKSLTNTPLLIEEGSFNAILDYVNSRDTSFEELGSPDVQALSGDERYGYVPESKTGVMHVSGPLTYRTTGWEALCGGTSYEMLKEQMEYFVGSGAKTVAMMVDSGGGQAHGMIDSAKYIRKLADDNGIRIIAYVDGMSASAAYGLSSVAHEIVTSRDSMVGSIGVLIQLMNNSKQLEKNGIERTFITAGADKVPFDKDGSFTESFLEGLQEQVDTLYGEFTGHVAEHRGISLDAVKGTEANVFMADKALELGLIDKVMTVEDFYDYLATEAQKVIEDKSMGVKDAIKLFNKGDAAEMAKLDELTAQLEAETAARAASDQSMIELATQLTTAQATIETLTAQLGSATADLQKFADLKAAEEKAAAEAKLESRKAALAEVMPTDQVETKLAAYSALDDATFAFMVSELAGAKEAKAESMEPVGGSGAELEDKGDATSALLASSIAAAKALKR